MKRGKKEPRIAFWGERFWSERVKCFILEWSRLLLPQWNLALGGPGTDGFHGSDYFTQRLGWCTIPPPMIKKFPIPTKILDIFIRSYSPPIRWQKKKRYQSSFKLCTSPPSPKTADYFPSWPRKNHGLIDPRTRIFLLILSGMDSPQHWAKRLSLHSKYTYFSLGFFGEWYDINTFSTWKINPPLDSG